MQRLFLLDVVLKSGLKFTITVNPFANDRQTVRPELFRADIDPKPGSQVQRLEPHQCWKAAFCNPARMLRRAAGRLHTTPPQITAQRHRG